MVCHPSLGPQFSETRLWLSVYCCFPISETKPDLEVLLYKFFLKQAMLALTYNLYADSNMYEHHSPHRPSVNARSFFL